MEEVHSSHPCMVPPPPPPPTQAVEEGSNSRLHFFVRTNMTEGPGRTICGRYYSYCLVGFDSYLDFKTVEFQERLPDAYICDSCGAVGAERLLLPCMHVSCLLCAQRHAGRSGWTIKCRSCNKVWTEDSVIRVACGKESLLTRSVRCPKASKGCDFVAALSSLKAHIRHCEYLHTVCSLCNTRVKFKELSEHYAACRTAFTSAVTASAESKRLLEDLANVKKEVEEAMAGGSSDEGTLRDKTASMLEVLERVRIQLAERGDSQNGSTQD